MSSNNNSQILALFGMEEQGHEQSWLELKVKHIKICEQLNDLHHEYKFRGDKIDKLREENKKLQKENKKLKEKVKEAGVLIKWWHRNEDDQVDK